MNIQTLVRESETLVESLDSIVEDIDDLQLQAIADSAWYRLGSVNVFVRDQCAGAVAASLARGLIEQAAYWDWALATGVGVDHLAQWAAVELDGLSRLAAEIDDDVWLGWLMPPGTALTAREGPAIPRSADDAVRRIGSGLTPTVLEPLRFDGLLSAYRILGVLAHGSYVGAAILADMPDFQLPDRLAAIVVHLAAAGATAVTFALADEESCLDAAATQFGLVACAASEIHGLRSQSSSVVRQPSRAKKALRTSLASLISRMPVAPSDLTDLGLEFIASTDDLADAVVSEVAAMGSSVEWIPLQSFRLSLSNLSVIRGGLDGSLGKALLPVAARMLFEDGARWNWLLHSIGAQAPGESFKALVNDGVLRRDRIVAVLQSDGVPRDLIDELLGPAIRIVHPEPGELSAPTMQDMLRLAYPSPAGFDSARVLYSVLSQFVHATPISNLHIQRDIFPSLSAPVYAVSLESAARGLERIASITPLLAGVKSEPIESPLRELRSRCAELVRWTSFRHLIG